ncbi:MAG: hypothetical protein GY696_30930, partial [Gammaproteobacteria bacterium]|nr:hypothetical protein [Gammaproteobacteria bacterium]
FVTTDEHLTAAQIVEAFVRRWSLETTFQEARALLGLETLRNRSSKAVNRSVPMLLCLYSYLVVWFARSVDDPESYCIESPWYKREHVTFSDMLSAARLNVVSELVNQVHRPFACMGCKTNADMIVSLLKLTSSQ